MSTNFCWHCFATKQNIDWQNITSRKETLRWWWGQCLSPASLGGFGWMFGGGSWGRLVRASKCVLRVAVANEGWMGADLKNVALKKCFSVVSPSWGGWRVDALFQYYSHRANFEVGDWKFHKHTRTFVAKRTTCGRRATSVMKKEFWTWISVFDYHTFLRYCGLAPWDSELWPVVKHHSPWL